MREGEWIAAAMSEAASASAHYDDQVKAEWAEEWASVVWVD